MNAQSEMFLEVAHQEKKNTGYSRDSYSSLVFAIDAAPKITFYVA